MPKGFSFAVSEAVAVLTFDRRQRKNALDADTLEDILQTLVETNDRGCDYVRAMVLTGAGEAFCSGGDIKTLKGHLDQGDEKQYLTRFTGLIDDIILAVREAPYPVIAAINGVVSGAGLHIALAADIRMAAQSARFRTAAYARLGMIPASGGSYLFPAVVGPGKAFEMCVLEQDMTAAQAQEAGLVTRVCADTDLVDEAGALANRLASGPTLAFMRTKELVNNFISGSNLEHHLHMELKFQKEMARTADFAEGVTAFTEKRKPRFTGR